ncbi:MAG TPA: glycosyltransferase family 2 protein [Leptolyngbyaceae cyanobacterium]
MGQLFEYSLVSVIIPTYNRAYLIASAIDSAIKQTYENLEIIVIDDASTDNTKEIVTSFDDQRIRYIIHPTNAGGAAARNTGIDAAKGKYLAFLDSDDVWLPNKIELQLAAIQNHPYPEKVVSYTQFKNDNGREVCIMPIRGKKDTENLADYLFVNDGQILTSILMFSRSLALTTKFRTQLKIHQDWDLCLRLEAQGAIFEFLEEPLTIWYNDRQSERISKSLDYQLSLNWIQEYQNLISSKANKGFLVKEVVPKLIKSEQRKLYATGLTLDAAIYRIISPYKFAVLMGRILISKRWRVKIKRMWKNNSG